MDAFEPALSETESKETQEMKKITLLEQFNKEEPDIEVIKKLLDDTYPSQRVCINRRERHHLNLENILKSHWPHLKKKSYFLAHADTLLGKKVQEVWNQNIELKVSEIVSYFRSYCGYYRGKKNSPETVEQMRKHFRDTKEAEKNLKSNKPKILAFLPLIACHFKEMNLATFIVSILKICLK